MATTTAPSSVCLYLFSGKIASGKSTLARQLAQLPATVLISEDRCLAELYREQMETFDDYLVYAQRLKRFIKPHVITLLQAGLSVALDFPANTVSARQWLKSIATEAGVAHELHYLAFSDAQCKRRLQERNQSGQHEFQVSEAEFDLITSHFVPPTENEGLQLCLHTDGPAE